MFDLALKDIWRHKLRSFLTISGIVIAIAAIVSLGSITAGINSMLEEEMKLMGGLISVTELGADMGPMMSGSRIEIEKVDEIAQMDGVEEVVPILIRQVPPYFIWGMDFSKLEIFKLENLKFDEGEWPESGEYEVALGKYVAESQGLSKGDTITVSDNELDVFGILEETGTGIDYSVMTSLKTAQEVFDEKDYITMITIKATDISEVDSIVKEIEDTYDDIDAMSDEESMKRAKEMISRVQLITFGIGFIAALVAAIGIINTMFMSVTEKKRQIGIMKGIGAEKKQILIQILEESIVLAVIGGLIGILFGLVGTAALNNYMGVPMARVTLSLAIYSFLFGIFLTLISSLYPAWQATKFDPVEAIRGG